MSQTKLVEKIKTHFVLDCFFPENRAVYKIMCEKYCTAGETKDDSMAHAQ
jgi:hypothetical protein